MSKTEIKEIAEETGKSGWIYTVDEEPDPTKAMRKNVIHKVCALHVPLDIPLVELIFVSHVRCEICDQCNA